MLLTLVNGAPVRDATCAISVEERGLTYGDGVFETMRLEANSVRFFDRHLARLRIGCDRLGIKAPEDPVLREDIAVLVRNQRDGVVKLIVTRGAGGRGYRPVPALTPTRVAILYPPNNNAAVNGVEVRWCTTRLARNRLLAGIKHLNRLEQVLAQNEWTEAHIAEGLMLDTEGELICGTSTNVFIVSDGALVTPDLQFSGVRGVMREQVIKLALSEGVAVEERPLRPDDLLAASEAFLTNAVRGIWPVVTLGDHRWPIGPMTARLNAALANAGI
jgi:4-amino-4-deoxychorismate lyase